MHVRTHAHANTNIRTQAHAHTHANSRACATHTRRKHTCTHTHTHTHTHTRTQAHTHRKHDTHSSLCVQYASRQACMTNVTDMMPRSLELPTPTRHATTPCATCDAPPWANVSPKQTQIPTNKNHEIVAKTENSWSVLQQCGRPKSATSGPFGSITKTKFLFVGNPTHELNPNIEKGSMRNMQRPAFESQTNTNSHAQTHNRPKTD